MPRWVFIALGALCVLPLVAVDPAAALLLFDIEVLLALGTAGTLMLRGDAGALWYDVLHRPGVLMLRAGLRLSRDSPASLVAH